MNGRISFSLKGFQQVFGSKVSNGNHVYLFEFGRDLRGIRFFNLNIFSGFFNSNIFDR